MGVHVIPPLLVLKSPPDAVATYTSEGFPGMPSTSVMRPPMDAGPMLRNSSRPNNEESTLGPAEATTDPTRRDNQIRSTIRAPRLKEYRGFRLYNSVRSRWTSARTEIAARRAR